MWFRKKAEVVPPKLTLKELSESRGSYTLDVECRICGKIHQQVIPKRCRPSDLVLSGIGGWHHIGSFFIIDDVTKHRYDIDSCENCGNNASKPLI